MFSKNRKRFALVPVALVTGVGIALVVGLGIFNRARGVELPERGVEIPLINLQNTALGLVAGRNGLPVHELEVVNSTTATYPLTGKTAHAFKVAYRAEKIFSVYLDEIGRELDEAQLMAAEQAAYAAKYGKLDPALAERLAGAPEDELIMVHIWLKAPPFTPPPAPDVHTPMTKDAPAQMEAYYKQLQSELAAAMAPVIAPIVERLAQRGIVDVMTNKYDPIIYARLTPKLIREVATWNEVDQVYMSQKGYDELENARPTIGADAVNGRGITGTGVRVAHMDIGSRIAANNPYLQGVTQDTTYVCADPQPHPTAIAGIIRSTHSTRRGIAKDVSLWVGGSCNANETEWENRADAAANWGAKAINLSYGNNIGQAPTNHDKFYDRKVFVNRITIVKSAGNEVCQGQLDGDISSPGRGYNIITVGAFDDKNSISWVGDEMWTCSSYVDPTSSNNDREKPEVVAPGVNINSTTTSDPWTGGPFTGTSYAAPMVAGVAALLINRM